MEAINNAGNLVSGNRQKQVLAGLATSVVAALIMAVVMMAVFTLFLGKGPIYPVQVIGSVVFGENALNGFNAAAFLAGLVVHLVVGLSWGIVFSVGAIFLKIRTPLAAAGLGLLVAAVSMSDTYVFVPAVMNALHGTDIWNREVPILWNWAAHAVFGASFFFYPKILKKLD